MTAIPLSDNSTVGRIYRHYEEVGEPEDRRSNGIGISELGEECERKVWYAFRWCLPIKRWTGRMRRLLNRGKREEPELIADLRAIGVEVYDVDEATGKQFRI